MEDIFKVIAKYQGITKHFSIWLFTEKLGKDKTKYDNFVKYPNSIKLPILLEYLESNGLPILELLLYYYHQIDYTSYEALVYLMIVSEFERIENKQPLITIPF